MESVFGPADWKTNITDGCDLFEERAETSKEKIALGQIKAMHELQFKINLAEEIISKSLADPTQSSPLLDKKFTGLKNALAEWKNKFSSYAQVIIPKMQDRLSMWVREHSPETHYTIYYDPLQRCLEKKKLPYLPLRSLPASFVRHMRDRVIERVRKGLDFENYLEDIAVVYPKVKELALGFMMHKGYNIDDEDQALVSVAADKKLAAEFQQKMDKYRNKTGEMAESIVSYLPKPWYLLFPQLGFEMADEIKPIVNQFISDSIRARFPGYEKLNPLAKQALSMLNFAKTPNEQMAAISYILTLQHNSGPMAEHFGLEQRDLDRLTNDMKMAEPFWKKEVEHLIPQTMTYRDLLGRGGPEDIYENFSVYQRKTQNWFKLSSFEEDDETTECPDFYSQLYKGSKGMLLDNGKWITWKIDQRGSPHHDQIIESCFKYNNSLITATHWWDGVLHITALGYEPWSQEVQSIVNSYYGNRTAPKAINIEGEEKWQGSFKEYSKYIYDMQPAEV